MALPSLQTNTLTKEFQEVLECRTANSYIRDENVTVKTSNRVNMGHTIIVEL